MEKRCTKCHETKTISSFTRRRVGVLPQQFSSHCNQCRYKSYLRRLGKEGAARPPKMTEEERRIKVNALNKKWREDNKQKWQIVNRANRHRRRGLGNINSTEWIAKVTMLGNKCQLCMKTEPEIKITIDHIIPVSKGGTNHIDNLQPLCMRCNQTKHARYVKPEAASLSLINNNS